MQRRPAALVSLALITVLSGCVKADTASQSGSTGALTISVQATKDRCATVPAMAPAGPLTFKLSNDDAPSISEIELKSGSKILGEKENLVPGVSGSFSLRLEAGTYSLYCPGASTEETPFVVTAR